MTIGEYLVPPRKAKDFGLFDCSACGYLLNRSTRKEEAQLEPWK
jgi:hypothetical protein